MSDNKCTAKIFEHLKNEIYILNKFTRRNKYEHKSSLILKKLQYLQKSTILFVKSGLKDDKELVLKRCMELYTMATSNLALKHYIALSYVTMGLAARIYFLVGKVQLVENRSSEIDDIFEM